MTPLTLIDRYLVGVFSTLLVGLKDKWAIGCILMGVCLSYSGACRAENMPVLSLAVASNFAVTAKQLADVFTEHHAVTIQISSASSGKLAAQIQHGAPYDLFFSADQHKALYLVEKGLAKSTNHDTYGLGRLAILAHQPGTLHASKGIEDFQSILRVAIANPQVAPYGQAARAYLDQFNRAGWQGKLVMAENVAQVQLFVETRSVDIGLVSYAQLKDKVDPALVFVIPDALYPRIRQDVILLNSADSKPYAKAFFAFVFSEVGREIIANSGYGLP